MPKEVEELVQKYRDGKISRREFIQQAVVFTGSLAVATSLIDSLASMPAHAALTDPNDPGLISEMVQFPGPAGTVFAYQSKPKAPGKYAAVIFIHDPGGVDEHNQDVARRFAKAGFLGLAVDYFSRHGGTKKLAGPGGGIPNFSSLATREVIVGDTEAAVTYLKGLKDVQGDRIGFMGFCWGGEMAFHAATQVRGLKALVIFYGRSPKPLDVVSQIEGPVMAHYAALDLDKGVTGGAPDTEAAMKKHGKSFEYKIYPGAPHAFHHDGRPDRYRPEAAKDAWNRTIEFFKKHLQS
jgi:carboxymethylenebutenolidase